MDIKAQYLEAMRQQAPKMFRRLTRSGELMTDTDRVSREAERMFRILTKDQPQPLSLQARREAEEQVRAEILSFPSEDTTMQQDEMNALRGDRPILSPERTRSAPGSWRRSHADAGQYMALEPTMKHTAQQHMKAVKLLRQKAKEATDPAVKLRLSQLANLGLAVAKMALNRAAGRRGAGGNKLGAGPTFDEDIYRQALPFFKAGVAHFREAASDVVDMLRALVRHLRTAGMSQDDIQLMKPYVERFMGDIKSGTETLDGHQRGDKVAGAEDVPALEPVGRTDDGRGQGVEGSGSGRVRKGRDTVVPERGRADDGAGRVQRPGQRPADLVVGANSVSASLAKEPVTMLSKPQQYMKSVKLLRQKAKEATDPAVKLRLSQQANLGLALAKMALKQPKSR
jgi:hypothetical protein